jgi:hypothetical protein
MFADKRVVFAIVDQMNIKKRHELLYNKMYDLTLFYTTRLAFTLRCPVVYHDTIDLALEALQDYDIVILQSVGNMIQENEYLEYVDEYVKNNPDFFYVGFTLDWQGDDWVELHHQMIVFNEQRWIQLGKPEYGNWQTTTEELPNYSRSVENFHDHYTPYWIKGEPGTTVRQRTKQGWGMIKAALENGIRIDNFTQAMRDCRLFLYPESDSVKFYECIVNREITDGNINPNQKRFIRTFQFREQVWIYNSESYQFPKSISSNIDTYMGPAAGFKYLDVLKYSEKVNYILYDFMPVSIKWIKMLRDEWDGRDYPAFLRKKEPEWKQYYKYISGDIELNQRLLFNEFSSEDEFVVLWQRFKDSSVEFIQCDLFDTATVKQLCTKIQGKTLFYYSNIFATDFQIKRKSLAEITASYDTIVNMFKQDNVILYGTNPVGEWVIQ